MAEMKVVTLDNLTYFAQKIDAELETKVNVKEGYALSKNDYSDAEKQRVADLETKVNALEVTGGQANVIETVKVNGTALVPEEKAVNIDLSAYALKQDIVSALDWKGTVATVDALPSEGNATGDIYHVTANSGEYAWDGSVWQELGSVVDLSAYYTGQVVDQKISAAVAPLAKSADVYLKTETYSQAEVNAELAKKSDNGHGHVIGDVEGLQTALDGKALKAHTHAIADVTDLQTTLDTKAVKTEVTEALALKANISDVNATVADLEAEIALKAVKTEVNEALALKANAADVTSAISTAKAELTTEINKKANAADFVAVTNSEIDALFATA